MSATPPDDHPLPGGHWSDAPPEDAWHQATPADDPLVAVDLAGWAGRVLGGLRRSGWRLLGLQSLQLVAQLLLFALVLVPLYLSGSFRGLGEDGGPEPPSPAVLLGFGGGLVLAVLLGVAAAAWGFAAACWVIVGDAFEEPVGVFDALRRSRGRVLPLLGWGLGGYLAAVVVGGLGWLVSWLVGSELLGSRGLTVTLAVALVGLPLLWLGVILGAGLPGTVVIERRDAGRCVELVTPRWWPTLGRLLLTGLVAGVAVLLLTGLQAALAPAVTAACDSTIVVGNLLLSLVQLLAAVAVAVFGCVAAVVTYAELRGHWDHTTTCETLAGDLGL